MEILKYKGYEGSAELNLERKVCWGKILYIDDVVTYESDSIADLQKQFEDAVDDYVETCELIGKEPQKSCRGLFNVRVSPELHKAGLRRAVIDDSSLNDVVRKALETYLMPKPDLSRSFTEAKHASTASTLHIYDLKPDVAMKQVFEARHTDVFGNAESVQDLTALVESDYWTLPNETSQVGNRH